MPSASLRPPPSAAATKRAANLHLSGLPRFHPGNYPTSSRVISSSFSSSSSSASASGSSSTAASPPSDLASPPSQISTLPSSAAHQRPQYHSRQYSDAQRKLHAYQREVMTRNYYGSGSSRPHTPTSPAASDLKASPRSPLSPRSPRLHPLGSPGPVTPFELEGEQDSYLFSGSTSQTQLSEEAKEQILESYMQKEHSFRASAGSAMQSRLQQYAPTSPGLRKGDPASHRSVLSR